MALPSTLLPQTAEHRRSSNMLVAATSFPFTKVLSRVDSPSIYVLFSTSGITADSTVTVWGFLSGVNQTETVSIPQSGSGSVRSTKQWSGITQMASPTVTGGSLTARAVYGSGQPANVESIITAALKGRLRPSRMPRLESSGPGPVLASAWVFYAQETAGLQPEDILVIAGVRYLIEDAPVIYAANVKHHIEARLRRLN